MGREIDSIPFYNDKKELVASYNAFYKVLYWGNAATKEDKIKVIEALEKKNYKNYTFWSAVEEDAQILAEIKAKVEEKHQKTAKKRGKVENKKK